MIRFMQRAAVVALLAVIVVPVGAAPANAHGQLAESTPVDGSSTDGVLENLTLYFTEAPKATATFVVRAPDATEVQAGWTPGESKRLRKPVQEFFLENGVFVPRFYNMGYAAVIPLTHLPVAGEYVVSYRSAASDGEQVIGSMKFTYRGEPTSPQPGVRTSPGGAVDPTAVFAPFVPATGSTVQETMPAGSAVEQARDSRPAAPGLRTPILVGAGLVVVLAAYVRIRLLARKNQAIPTANAQLSRKATAQCR